MKLDELEICKEFMGRAREILSQEFSFELTDRYAHGDFGSKEAVDRKKLHEAHQVIAWQKVKKMYVEHEDIIQTYKQEAPETDRDIIGEISRVIHDEINELLLKEENEEEER